MLMDSVQYLVVYVTAATSEEASAIALTLVEEKLVACATTVRDVRSLYWWHGKVEDAGEQLLVMKTPVRLLDAVIARVKALHTYEVPEIIALPIVGGNSEYLRWIDESVRA